MNDAAPPQAPDFDFLRPIGEGGFGQVWLAVNRTTGQPRAVKVIPRAGSNGRDPAGREIASLTRLEVNLRCRHPNLLVIHHVGETAEHLFYVMDLADDLSGNTDPTNPDYRPATLESRLAAGPLDAADCERYTAQLLAALACLHEAGMVHRDVKPANCLFLAGELKLADFGLLTAASLSTSRLGTVRYMPPDGCMDARADVYAAGLVIYEMLTGLSADRFPSLGLRAQAIVEDRRLARLNRLALQACDPDPGRRFRDAREMLADLTAPERSPAKRRRRWPWLMTGMLIGAALGLFMLWPLAPVTMTFVSSPFEATIYVDGQQLRDPHGDPYRTPCTVPNLPGGKHRVVFQWDAQTDPSHLSGPDGKLDAGEIDFTTKRQITARCATK
jgi:eukaryotic-like serine/threonine-protein kinase